MTLNSYFPSYNGTNNADDPLVTPWWIPGWTAQDKIVVPAANNAVGGTAFPSDLAFVRVTGQFFDLNESGIPGYVTCYMSDSITVNDHSAYFRLPQRLTGVMNFPNNLAYSNWGNGLLYLGLGLLDITLFATDQTVSGALITTDSGLPFTYWVTEHWVGGRRYQITVPSASSPGPVDIDSLIVSGSATRYKFDPTWPMGNDYMPMTPPSSC